MTWTKLSRQFGMVLPVFVVLWFTFGNQALEDWTGLSMLSEFAFGGFAVIALYFNFQIFRLLLGGLLRARPVRGMLGDLTRRRNRQGSDVE